MGAVQNLCDRALLLHQGNLVFDGAPEDCVSRYFNLHQPRANAAEGIVVEGRLPEIQATSRAALVAANVLPLGKSRHGDKSLEIVAAAAFDGHGAAGWDYEMMHRMSVRLLLRANRAIQLPSIGIQLHDRMGNLIFAAGTTQLRFALPSFAAGQEVILDFRVTLTIQPGAYTLSLDAAEHDIENPNIGNFFDRVGGLGPVTVTSTTLGVMPFYGAAQIPMEISFG
jgi:lipopolysaccharide transport system ATP-binding protein